MYNYTISFTHPDAGARTDAVEAGPPRTPGRGKSAVGCPVHKEALHAPCACRQ